MVAAPPPPNDDDLPSDVPLPNPKGGIYMVVNRFEWDDLRKSVERAKQYSMEARDSSKANSLVLEQVLKPKVEKLELDVEHHDEVLNRGKGAMWAIGIIYGLAIVVLGFILR